MKETQLAIFLIGILLILIIIIIVETIYFYVCHRIHISYHKGYNDSNNNEINYYKSIREIEKSIRKIFELIEADNFKVSFKNTKLILEHLKLIKRYRNKF